MSTLSSRRILNFISLIFVQKQNPDVNQPVLRGIKANEAPPQVEIGHLIAKN